MKLVLIYEPRGEIMTLLATIGRAPLRLALTTAVVAALYGTPSAFAGAAESTESTAAAPATAANNAEPTRLESLVVTANKRIEKLENVPMSISVMRLFDEVGIAGGHGE